MLAENQAGLNDLPAIQQKLMSKFQIIVNTRW